MADLLYLHDAYLHSFAATVVDTRTDAVALDRTAFYATGRVRPNDAGRWAGRCGGVGDEWDGAATRGNMEPVAPRMDAEQRVDEQPSAARPIEALDG